MADVVEYNAATGKTTARAFTAQELAERLDPAVEARSRAEAAIATNVEAIRVAALAALEINRAHIARAAPTAAQNTAQIKALARQNNGIIRLLLGQLDATD